MLDTKYHSSNWHLNTVWTRIQLMNEWIIMSIIWGFDRISLCVSQYRYIKGQIQFFYTLQTLLPIIVNVAWAFDIFLIFLLLLLLLYYNNYYYYFVSVISPINIQFKRQMWILTPIVYYYFYITIELHSLYILSSISILVSNMIIIQCKMLVKHQIINDRNVSICLYLIIFRLIN